MKKAYEDGLKDCLGIIEDIYAHRCPVDDWDECCDLVRKVVDEVFVEINKLADLSQEPAV